MVIKVFREGGGREGVEGGAVGCAAQFCRWQHIRAGGRCCNLCLVTPTWKQRQPRLQPPSQHPPIHRTSAGTEFPGPALSIHNPAGGGGAVRFLLPIRLRPINNAAGQRSLK